MYFTEYLKSFQLTHSLISILTLIKIQNIIICLKSFLRVDLWLYQIKLQRTLKYLSLIFGLCKISFFHVKVFTNTHNMRICKGMSVVFLIINESSNCFSYTLHNHPHLSTDQICMKIKHIYHIISIFFAITFFILHIISHTAMHHSKLSRCLEGKCYQFFTQEQTVA